MSLSSQEQAFYVDEEDGTFSVYSPSGEFVRSTVSEKLAGVITTVQNTKVMIEHAKNNPPKTKGTLSL